MPGMSMASGVGVSRSVLTPPPSGGFLITESGDFIVTEAGDKLEI